MNKIQKKKIGLIAASFCLAIFIFSFLVTLSESVASFIVFETIAVDESPTQKDLGNPGVGTESGQVSESEKPLTGNAAMINELGQDSQRSLLEIERQSEILDGTRNKPIEYNESDSANESRDIENNSDPDQTEITDERNTPLIATNSFSIPFFNLPWQVSMIYSVFFSFVLLQSMIFVHSISDVEIELIKKHSQNKIPQLSEWMIQSSPLLGLVGTLISMLLAINASPNNAIKADEMLENFINALNTTVFGAMIYIFNYLLSIFSENPRNDQD